MILGNSLDCMVIVQYPDLQLTQLKALPKIPKIYQRGVNFGGTFQRKSIILFGTAIVTLNTVRNDLGWAQIKGVGAMNSFT